MQISYGLKIEIQFIYNVSSTMAEIQDQKIQTHVAIATIQCKMFLEQNIGQIELNSLSSDVARLLFSTIICHHK